MWPFLNDYGKELDEFDLWRREVYSTATEVKDNLIVSFM
jgi:hypothetical protein